MSGRGEAGLQKSESPVSVQRGTAPIAGSVRWLLASILLWEATQALRGTIPEDIGSWPLSLVELLLFSAVPALTAFAFVRLFLAAVQASYGSLNTYTLTSSPWAWAFWLGLAVAMTGQGAHMAADIINQALPDVVANGRFAAQVGFLDEDLGHWLLGTGFLVTSSVVLFLGQGQGHRAIGGERTALALGSLVTYGFVIVFVGVEGGQLVPAILGSALLTALGVAVLPPAEISRDPVGLLVVPGTAAGGLVLFVWGLLVGGQPSWPL
ncbi:MAG: hypothetical protein Kow00129_15830 [Thermoleophilia bacterium]